MTGMSGWHPRHPLTDNHLNEHFHCCNCLFISVDVFTNCHIFSSKVYWSTLVAFHWSTFFWVNLGGISSFGCAAWILASLQLIHVHMALSVWFLVFASSALSAIHCKLAIVSGLAKRDDSFEVLFFCHHPWYLQSAELLRAKAHRRCRMNRTRGRHIVTLLTSKMTCHLRKWVCPQTPLPTLGVHLNP